MPSYTTTSQTSCTYVCACLYVHVFVMGWPCVPSYTTTSQISCTYVCASLYVHVFVMGCPHAPLPARPHVRMYVCTYVCMYVCIVFMYQSHVCMGGLDQVSYKGWKTGIPSPRREVRGGDRQSPHPLPNQPQSPRTS